MKKTRIEKGITLIALIVTIAVLLILAAVAISSVTDDGVLTKSKEEKYSYEIAQEKSNLKTEVLKWQAITSHEPTLENYLDEIYGEENVELNADDSLTVTVPSGNKYIVTEGGVEVYCDHTNTVVKNVTTATCTTEGYTGDTVCVECERIVSIGTSIAALNHPNTEIRNETELYTGDTYCTVCGMKIASGEYATISTASSYVGYYANLDDDAEPEGIIYADLAHSVSGQWLDSNGTFSYSAITGTKDYYISQKEYEGDFGTKDIITVVPDSTGSDRFYVMDLEDFENRTYYSWYESVYDYGGISNYSSLTSTAFGKGKSNTTTMITKWNNSAYGEQNADEKYLDMFGVIQDKVADGWFVPSKQEWAAFGYNLGIELSEDSGSIVSRWYWSSSLASSTSTWIFRRYVGGGIITNLIAYQENYVRLSTTF